MTESRDTKRLLVILQRLLECPAADMRTAMTHAANALAEALSSDKVDAFVYDGSRDCLVAVGTSTQPLSELQKRLGLDVLQLSNDGRTVEVYRTGRTWRSGNVRDDPEELLGVKEGLKIQSQIGVPLEVAGHRRGVVLVTSLQPDFFDAEDEAFAESAVRWIGFATHRAELVADIARIAGEKGRQSVAEELVTVLAHDIRNYLAPVSGRLFALRHRAQSEGRSADLADAQAAVKGVERLGALVGNLLDVARLDRGLFELDVAAVDLVALARDAAETFSTAAHQVQVDAFDMVVVEGDVARIRQCVDNVIANAISHSPDESPVLVLVGHAMEDGKRWGQLEVLDQGPGVPEEIRPHLFDRFVTGRAASGGLGLGLYFAKRLAAAHGGDLRAEPNPASGGARFLLRLPLFRSNGAPP
jgi:two-component system OmpR family sensor kinase